MLRISMMTTLIAIVALMLASCSSNDISTTTIMEDLEEISTPVPAGFASVTGVTATGEANNYNFSVTIASPDTGCDQYADWWEVFTADGVLIYRRILAHSHVDEQPFTRSGEALRLAQMM